MLRERVTDFSDLTDSPLTQLLINSHSPVVLGKAKDLLQQHQGRSDSGRSGVHVVFADLADLIDSATGTRSRKSRVREVFAGDQGRLDEAEGAARVSDVEVERFLMSAQGTA